MSAFAARREANKQGRFHSVKTGFKQIFTHPGLAAKVEQAVHLVTPILTEGSLLANLHVIRCMESGQSPPIDQTFFNHCYSAVSHSTGNRAQDFVPAKDPSLAESYDLYTQCLPALHTKPERPTYIKDVSNLINEALTVLTLYNNHKHDTTTGSCVADIERGCSEGKS